MANNNYQDDELDDNEDVVEAHDPKNAEKQSIGSVATAGGATKRAPQTKGSKVNGDAMTKVKANMISVAHDLMSEMTEDELEEMIDMVMENGKNEEAEELDEISKDMANRYLDKSKKSSKALGDYVDKTKVRGGPEVDKLTNRVRGQKMSFQKTHGYAKVAATESTRMKDYEIDYTDLNALVESEATLSEEFKAKTALIFETAVKSQLSEEIDRLEEAYAIELEEELAATKADLVEKVDSYLNYVVETWMEENKLAVQAGLRTEIAETFMSKLKDLFVESYVDVPESKVDLVDELADANDELEEQLNSAVAKGISLAEELEYYKRDAIIREAAKGLATTQVEKLKSLVEDIDFDDVASFTQKVKTIKEAYFKKKTAESTISEDTGSDDNVEEVSDTMAQYLKAIRKSNI